MPGRRPRRVLTPEEVSVVKSASAMGLPVEQIATLLSMSKTAYDKMMAKDAALQDTVAKSRVQAGYVMRQRLYDKAQKGDFQAMKFWLQTREGFRITDRVEHTGADGRPIQTKTEVKGEASRQDVMSEIQALSQRLKEKYGQSE